MKTINEAAKDYASKQWGDYSLKAQERVVTKEDFKAGVKFAERWIPVEEELPETNTHIIAEKDNGLKLGLYFNADGRFMYGSLDQTSQVTHWRPINNI